MRLRSRLFGAGMADRLQRQVRALGLATPDGEAAPVAEADLAGLPEAAQRWLRTAGVVGRARDRTVQVHWLGQFRLKPRGRWMPFEAWQHNTARPVARLYRMRIDVGGVLPMFGVDSYLDGHGRMRGRLLGAVPVADGSGPEFDVGELVTWLDDAVLLAPSMLLDPAVTWGGVDDATFDVGVTDGGRTATVRVRVDEAGRVRDVATDDRYCALPSGPVRARWTTPVDGWMTVDGRPVPMYARAIWELPEGRWTYARARLDPHGLSWDGRHRSAVDAGPGPGRAPR